MYAKFVNRALLITLLAVAYPAASFAGFLGVGVTVGFAPPPLPVYVQPPCPAAGYIWTLDMGVFRGRSGLLLGAGHVGSGTYVRLAVDSRLLGL